MVLLQLGRRAPRWKGPSEALDASAQPSVGRPILLSRWHWWQLLLGSWQTDEVGGVHQRSPLGGGCHPDHMHPSFTVNSWYGLEYGLHVSNFTSLEGSILRIKWQNSPKISSWYCTWMWSPLAFIEIRPSSSFKPEFVCDGHCLLPWKTLSRISPVFRTTDLLAEQRNVP